MKTLKNICAFAYNSSFNLFYNRQGSIAVIVGITMSIVILAIAIGVDIGRGYFARSRVSYSMDAAILAVSGELPNLPTDTDINNYATRFFNLNYPTNYLGSTVNSLKVTVDRQALAPDTISMSVSVTVPTIFGNVIKAFSNSPGLDNIVVTASSQAQRENKVIEVALALDNTGSMGKTDGGSSLTRLQALKNSATTLVKTLFKSSNVNPPYISVVPFTANVNIAPFPGFLALGQPNDFMFPSNSPWQGCVDERKGVNAYTDANPSVSPFYAFYNKTNNANPNDNCTIAKILPLTNQQQPILDLINSMTNSGNTTIYKGVLWGWRTLSPNWQGKWTDPKSSAPTPTNRPAPYNAANLTKILVVLTDGDNFSGNAACGVTDLNSTTTLYAGQYPCNSDLDKILTSTCNSVKSAGIIIYTIGLGADVNNSANVRNLLRNCASDPGKFFATPQPQDLENAFQVIAASVSKLRLTQ